MVVKERIANTVALQRKQAGLTQEELAKAVDVTRQTVIAIEKGNYVPSVLLAIKLAKYFKVAVEKVFHYETY